MPTAATLRFSSGVRVTRGCGILVAFGLALSGCKYLEKAGRGDRPPPDDRTSFPASARRDRRAPAADPKPDNHWLDGPTARNSRGDLPEAPAGRSGPAFGDQPRGRSDDSKAVQGTLAGYVADEFGLTLRGVFLHVTPADRTGSGAATGVETTDDGSFQIDGLRSGQTYILSARTTREGVTLAGQMYTRPPNPRLLLVVREGLSLPGDSPRGGANSAGEDLGTLRRPPTAAIRPEPVPLSGDRGPALPPADAGRSDGSYSPTGPAPALSKPDPVLTRPPGRPELTTDGPPPGFRPPPTNITPPDKLLAVPSLPPAPGADPGRSESRSVRPKSEFVLLDTLGRPREFPTGRDGELVLIEFMTTKCAPCKQAVPALKDIQARYGARGLDVIGVACDEVDTPQRRVVAASYQRAEDLNYLLYVEPGSSPGRIRDRFEVEHYPMMVLLNAAGDVLWKGSPKELAALERVIDANLGR